MEKVFLEKYMDLSTIREVDIVVLMSNLTKMANPVATSIPNMCQRALADTTFHLAQKSTRLL
jgi:hypothetical protein